MSDALYQVFISYTHADHDLVLPYVEKLKREGITVWWDKEIYEGFWGDQIEVAFKASQRVLLFMSSRAALSQNVYVEADDALRAGKLIPIYLERDIPKNLRGRTALLQSYDFSKVVDIEHDPIVQRLCGLCRGGAPVASRKPSPSTAYEDDDLSQWLHGLRREGDLPYALALSVLEGHPHEIVQAYAERLDAEIRPVPSQATARQEWDAFAKTRRALMAACEAEIFEETPAGLSTPFSCARFRDATRAGRLLDEVWCEFDRLRPALVDWLRDLAANEHDGIRASCIDAVGVLAQSRFHSVYDALIQSWLAADAEDPASRPSGELAREGVGDAVLATAAMNPMVSDTVAKVLERWAAPNAPTQSVRIAINLSCGLTGMRLPKAAITTLKALARRDIYELISGEGDLIEEASTAIKGLATRYQNFDEPLFDLQKFIVELEEWAAHPGKDDLALLPDHLLLCVLELVSSQESRGVTLESLQQDQNAWAAALAAIERCLRNKLSDRVQTLLKAWTEADKNSEASGAAVAFVRDLWRLANTDRDRERIAFTVRKAISLNQIRADIDLAASGGS